MLITPATTDDPTMSRVSALAMIVVLLGVIGVCVLLMLAARRRARVRRAGLTRDPKTELPDAWEESGKRVDPSISSFDIDDEAPGESGPKTWS